MALNMADLFEHAVDTFPDRLALICGDRHVTYRELEDEANRLAHTLLSLGITPGQNVIWCGPNSPQVVAVMGAARKVGAVAVPLNYRLTAEEARYVINHSDAEIAYVDAEYAHLFAGLVGDLEKLRAVVVYGGPVPSGMPRSPR